MRGKDLRLSADVPREVGWLEVGTSLEAGHQQRGHIGRCRELIEGDEPRHREVAAREDFEGRRLVAGEVGLLGEPVGAHKAAQYQAMAAARGGLDRQRVHRGRHATSQAADGDYACAVTDGGDGPFERWRWGTAGEEARLAGHVRDCRAVGLGSIRTLLHFDRLSTSGRGGR